MSFSRSVIGSKRSAVTPPRRATFEKFRNISKNVIYTLDLVIHSQLHCIETSGSS